MRLQFTNGNSARARTVVIASGASYRRPPISNLPMFEGRGVSYWASAVEAKLCEGEEVALVGGGNSAGPGRGVLGAEGEAAPSRGARREAWNRRCLAISSIASRRCRMLSCTRRRKSSAWKAMPPTGLTGAVFRHRKDRNHAHLSAASSLPFHRRRPERKLARRLCRGRRQGIRDHRRIDGLWRGPCCRWRRAEPAFSPSAMSAPVRPSASPPPSAKAPRWWRKFTACWRVRLS